LKPVALFESFVDLCQGETGFGTGDGETAFIYEIAPLPEVVFTADVAPYPSAVLGDDEVRA
jgi:hypothetical protein